MSVSSIQMQPKRPCLLERRPDQILEGTPDEVQDCRNTIGYTALLQS